MNTFSLSMIIRVSGTATWVPMISKLVLGLFRLSGRVFSLLSSSLTFSFLWTPILDYEVSSFTNSGLNSSPLSFIYVLCFSHLSHAEIPDLSLSSYPLFRPVKIFSFLDTLAITILSGIIPVSLLFKFAFSFAFFSRPLFSIAAASLFI